MPPSIIPPRSYRATLVPSTVPYDQVETHDAAGLLPTIRVKATNCTTAMFAARHVSGHAVLRAERVEGGAA